VSILAALVTAAGLFLLVTAGRRIAVGERLAAYLTPGPGTRMGLADHIPPRRVPTVAVASRAAPAAAGAAAGWLLASGHLFVRTAAGTTPALMALGAAAGLLGRRLHRRHAAETRALRLRRELPTVADTLALSVLAGESVAGAVERFAATSQGVAAAELRAIAVEHRAGRALPEALARAAAATAHAEAGRLYDLLGHAHRSGGRLADALADLAVDYRAALARDLTAEGGRRALAAYGPILALMVPVTLLFLMYPTLTGLAALSSPAP
jgi:tight adherence protein C